MKTGQFITLEGGEGAGKSTLISAVSAHLSAKSIPHILTREPGGTELAEAVRSLVLQPPGDTEWSPLSQALLMNAARRDHLEQLIWPALERGDWVLCDRFSDSTLAYQSVGGVPMPTLLTLERLVSDTTQPSLTLILDAPPEALAERRKARGGTDIFEQKGLSFHQGIRAAFLEIAEVAPDRCVVLDALQPPDALARAAIAAIETRLIEKC